MAEKVAVAMAEELATSAHGHREAERHGRRPEHVAVHQLPA